MRMIRKPRSVWTLSTVREDADCCIETGDPDKDREEKNGMQSELRFETAGVLGEESACRI